MTNCILAGLGVNPYWQKNIIIDISKYIKLLAKSHPNLNYRAGMTTNGYLLTPSLLSEMAFLGILDYQITLDGPQEIHDKNRVKVNGEGTYDRIWENMLAIRESSEQVRVSLRIHFDPSRIPYMDRLINDVRREFLHDKRFSVHFKAIRKLGGKDDDNIEMFSVMEEQECLKMLKQKLYCNVMEANEPPYVCYASRPNSFVIYPNGDIGKCTVALNNPNNKIGSINEDGTIRIDSKLLRAWLRGFTAHNLAILECPLRNFPDV